MPKLTAYGFLRWFVTDADFESGDEIAEVIRVVIWPNPLHWYTGGVRVAADPVVDPESTCSLQFALIACDSAEYSALRYSR